MKNTSNKIVDDDSINTLHKYYIWANRMKTHFDGLLLNINTELSDGKKALEIDMYMSLWYGLMYVVIEGWRQLKLKDTEINDLIKNKNTELLQGYRNGVFHFHRINNDVKFERFFQERTTVEWVRSLNQAFGRWFLNYYVNKKD